MSSCLYYRNMNDNEWHLLRHNNLLGKIRVTDKDVPWLIGEFLAEAEFEDIKHLFDKELELLNNNQAEEWGKVYDEISLLTLKSPDGSHVSEFLLHIKGKRAWWRYNEKPSHGKHKSSTHHH